MPARPKISGSWAEQQPKYVEIPCSPSDQDVRPQFEKMLSCDFSVEESFTTNDTREQDYIKICGFPKKPDRVQIYSPFPPSRWFDKKEKQAAFKKLDFESADWKVGAVESEKSRSPTEHDDRDEPKTIEDADLNEEVAPLLEHTQTCTKNLEAEVLYKDKELTVVSGTVKSENPFPVKRKFTSKKKSKSPLKRQSIGKKKRNKWVILCDEEPLKPVRQKKLSLSKKTCSSKAHKKHYSTSQCKDSGVSSGSSCDSGSGSGGDSGSHDRKNGRVRRGGGGSDGGGRFQRNGGMGGAGRDDDSDEKRPLSSGDTEMKDEDETEDDLKMKTKGSSNMDCEDDSLEKHSVEWQSLHFQTQDLQHSCYCSKNEDCDRHLCVQMKKELKHYKEKFCEQCGRCQKIINLLKMHASTCQRPGCRVPYCLEQRAKKAALPPQVPKVQYDNVQKSFPSPPSVDGQVIYSNSPHFGRQFQEYINYNKGHILGKGANGNVYEVHFPPGHILKETSMVVKETNYIFNKEEIDVYNSIGNHENIVQHHCVTLKGDKYQMAVFMERCDKSLRDICDVRTMDTNEVMFYWTQVLVAVDHLHDKGIIHKDIKAKNIMLSEIPGKGEHCRAKLADYDSAKKLESEFTQSGLRPLGTRGFAAPEVIDLKPHGRPADVYSMGCLLLELHGITPKQDSLLQQVEQLYNKDPNQAQLVSYCVQYDYNNRPTAKQLMNLPYVQEFQRVPDQL